MIMRRYTPALPRSSTGAAPPGSVSPLPGIFSVHSGAFSFTSRLADAYSARTFFQSHWSSSATIIGFTVSVPVPSSVWPTRMVTVSSGAIVIQALISGTIASRYQGWAATGTLAASAPGGSQKPRTIALPTAAVVARNSRRSISVVPSGAILPSGCSVFFSLMVSSSSCCALAGLHSLRSSSSCCALAGLHSLRSSSSCCALAGLHSLRLSRLGAQGGCPVDCLADAVIGPAPAGVGHLGIDVGVRGLWLLFEQRHRCQNLPGLAVATLRNVKLLPGKLDRVRSVGRQPFDGGDLLTDGPARLQEAGAHRQAIDQHGAGAGLADAAPILRAGEADRIAKHPQQRRLRFRVHAILDAIDEKCER